MKPEPTTPGERLLAEAKALGFATIREMLAADVKAAVASLSQIFTGSKS